MFEIAKLKLIKVQLGDEECVLINFEDQTEILQKALIKLQKHSQKVIINALSHERMTPLNSILNISEIILKEKTFNDQYLKNIEVIWSSAKLMHLLTLSQIIQYKIYCKQFTVQPEKSIFPTLEQFLVDFLKPFQINLRAKGMTIEMNIAVRNLLNSQEQEINKYFWTDWQVYKCILFHLVQNAIKHGSKNSLI